MAIKRSFRWRSIQSQDALQAVSNALERSNRRVHESRRRFGRVRRRSRFEGANSNRNRLKDDVDVRHVSIERDRPSVRMQTAQRTRNPKRRYLALDQLPHGR